MSNLTFDDYQDATGETAIYPGHDYQVKPGETLAPIGTTALLYLVCGLVEELGEMAGKIKKIIRDQGGVFTAENIEAIGKEASDEIWYWSRFTRFFGLSGGTIARQNLDRLRSRKQRGVLGGSGDNR